MRKNSSADISPLNAKLIKHFPTFSAITILSCDSFIDKNLPGILLAAVEVKAN